jgi:radical SAM enzyme (rSAM/lipoprotein system)
MINAEKISLKKKIALNLYTLKKGIEARTHELNYLFWECTLRCNLSCLHCGSDCSRDSKIQDMPVQDFLKVLDIIKETNDQSKIIVVITGGEPLMRTDLAKAGYEIYKKGYPWGMVTNGYLLTKDKMNELLESGLRSMTISFDGLEEDHNWFRGNKESYKRALAAIGYAVESAKKGMSFDVVTCVNKRNVKDLEKIKDVLIKEGVRDWRAVSIFPKGRARDNDELLLSGSQLQHLLEFITATRIEGKIKVSYGCEGFLGGYEMEARDIPFNCRAGIGVGSVLVDGSISACPSLRADFIQGNIYKDNFMDVWNNRYQVMRDRAWLKKGECANCKVWKHCKGNGLHLRTENNGELLYCNYKALTEVSNGN